MKITDYIHADVKPHYIPDFDPKSSDDWYGIKALWYEGASYKGKRTKVFAYIGFPSTAATEKVPAVVLVHGGGGHAFPEWIKLWNNRGFAAIAMDTTGYFPAFESRGLVERDGKRNNIINKYERKLYGELLEEGFTVGPDNSSMKDYDLPLGDQWMFHAVVDTVLAHNILLQDNRIDSNNIGIVGLSWGSVITAIAVGYDTRYAFATCIYGSAHLDEPKKPMVPEFFDNEKVLKLWNANDRLKNVDFPILWICSGYDTCFDFRANSKSYLDTKFSGSCLSICKDFFHDHISGWLAPEVYRFAEKTVEKQLPLIKAVTEPVGFNKISFEIDIPEDFKDVFIDIYYLTEPVDYDENNNITGKWESLGVVFSGNTVTAEIPKNAVCYYVQLKGYINTQPFITTTSVIEK